MILDYSNFFLVGIKGVAMTSLAQCLVDAGKTVTGSDVTEDFVTQPLLAKLNISIQPFSQNLPPETDAVIYTAAHAGPLHPQVITAQKSGVPVYSQAEAVAELANQQQPIAVCGVGGKSTVSAMITWILEQINPNTTSFSVGVGDIINLHKTGQWLPHSQWFVIEADDYVTDPNASSRGERITPRFSFLSPQLIVATNIKYDHPDVYTDFNHTQTVFSEFFASLRSGGQLIFNGDDNTLQTLSKSSSEPCLAVGWSSINDWQLTDYQPASGISSATLTTTKEKVNLSLTLPGKFNLHNAALAVAAVTTSHPNISLIQAVTALATFSSTLRRSEFIGEKRGVLYYDDYAHHPSELKAIMTAFQDFLPNHNLVFAFQPHTFSRTKELFAEFVDVLSQPNPVLLLDIFASAREPFDPRISSDDLVRAIKQRLPQANTTNIHSVGKLADWCTNHLKPGSALITLGAGDIYQVHDLIPS